MTITIHPLIFYFIQLEKQWVLRSRGPCWCTSGFFGRCSSLRHIDSVLCGLRTAAAKSSAMISVIKLDDALVCWWPWMHFKGSSCSQFICYLSFNESKSPQRLAAFGQFSHSSSLCILFLLLFSGTSFCMHTGVYLQSPFTQIREQRVVTGINKEETTFLQHEMDA